METQKLLFELCHETRYAIMIALAEEPRRLTKLAEITDANNPEVSRHLDRLRAASLVGKDQDGQYILSPTGSLILSLLPSFSFIAHNQDFLEDHDLSGLPPQFVSRIGEVGHGKRSEGIFGNMKISTDIHDGAKELLNIITAEIPDDPGHAPDYQDKSINRRIIVSRDARVPDWCDVVDFCDYVRFLKDIPVSMIMSESMAAIVFPNRKGLVDFTVGFSSDDPVFWKWCSDLFDHLWNESVTLTDHILWKESQK